ncbi:MAG: general secretion pathway protein C [Pseudohongiellaceae bacterium]|jgi:general secretion pathway protein C
MITVVPEQLLPVLRYAQGISQPAWYKAVCFLLSVLLVVSLVQWLWLLIPEPEARTAPAVVSAAQKTSAKVDVAKLQSFNLFGASGGELTATQAVVPLVQKTVDAEPTRLKLALSGVVVTPNPKEALAMIQYQGKEDQYAIGDKLPMGRVVLSQIHHDHVIIENAGRYESLWLFDGETNTSATPAPVVSASPVKPSSKKLDMRQNKQLSSTARNYRNRLYNNPSSLADVIRISPQQSEGQLKGYRVSPGRDKKQFEALGLKPNDVVTSINGIELDDPAKAVEVYKIIRSASEATFVIDRKGEVVELVVSLAEG